MCWKDLVQLILLVRKTIFSDSVTTFDGSALAAVRWKNVKSKEPAVLKVWTDDGCQVMINIENN